MRWEPLLKNAYKQLLILRTHRVAPSEVFALTAGEAAMLFVPQHYAPTTQYHISVNQVLKSVSLGFLAVLTFVAESL